MFSTCYRDRPSHQECRRPPKLEAKGSKVGHETSLFLQQSRGGMEPYTKHSEKCQNSKRFQASLQKTQSRNVDSHIAGVSVGVKMEVWRTTGCRHFLRVPAGPLEVPLQEQERVTNLDFHLLFKISWRITLLVKKKEKAPVPRMWQIS